MVLWNFITKKCVIMLNYFNWSEISIFSQNATYLTTVINWEDLSFLYLSDLFFPIRTLFHVFFSFFWSTNALNYSSLLGGIFSALREPLFLINAFFLDSFISVTAISGLNMHFFLTSHMDLALIMPELVFFFNSLNSDLLPYAHTFVSVLYDSYLFNVANSFIVDFVLFFFWLFLTLFFIFLFFGSLSMGGIGAMSGLNFFLTKFYLFANHFSYENRLQLDWVLFFLLFGIVLWVPLLMTYDDTNVEFIELLHSFICLFFIFIIVYLLYRYSIHYFAFLENTVSDGFSTAYLLKQFVRDVSNTFALFLRFFLLLFRLNIYDGLDDFLDSYYIFFIDFDEDSYFDELFVSFDFLFYFADNREDVIFYKPTEFEWWGDIFTKFFILFGKFFFFWALILEEIFRVTLALYISYLIVFEVHAVNVSFNEDHFIRTKKTN
uniref:hypothetical protein n=1 Tax=Euplotes vannus TaxID=5939 RepID=UPI002E7858F0|nr:hypothetical protein V3A05_mgp31 [Euplotes vannus]UPM52097.1 hypothetical protein [Euplotes vannus]